MYGGARMRKTSTNPSAVDERVAETPSPVEAVNKKRQQSFIHHSIHLSSITPSTTPSSFHPPLRPPFIHYSIHHSIHLPSTTPSTFHPPLRPSFIQHSVQLPSPGHHNLKRPLHSLWRIILLSIIHHVQHSFHAFHEVSMMMMMMMMLIREML